MTRYKVIEGSESAHCCFEATVVDTATKTPSEYKILCECFTKQDAELICRAMNAAEAGNVADF